MDGSAPLDVRVDLTLRVSAEQFDRLVAAAHLAGVGVADFVLVAAMDVADDALSGDRLIRLSPIDADMVAPTLDAPAPASEALRHLMASAPPWKVTGDDRS